MVYTRLGYELARITVVNLKKEVIYDTLVQPKYPIECYNTVYSGIEEKMMEGVKTTLKDVQAVLLSLFSNKTIIIGHSLDSDLRALHVSIYLIKKKNRFTNSFFIESFIFCS